MNEPHFERGCENVWCSKVQANAIAVRFFAFGVRGFAFQVFEQVFLTELCVSKCFGELWRA